MFDVEFENIAKTFKQLYFTLFLIHSNKFQIDVMNRNNPIIFEDKLIQKTFNIWLK